MEERESQVSTAGMQDGTADSKLDHWSLRMPHSVQLSGFALTDVNGFFEPS